MKEYGTNVQKLLEYILTVSDRETRTKYAYLLAELMRQIHPNMRDGQDYTAKLWDDLYIMSNFELDVDSPFPPPPIESVGRKPQKVTYSKNDLRYKHYGKNVELIIKKAIETENEEEKLVSTAYVFRLMKSLYQTWNKEVIEDEVIFNQLNDLSRGKLKDCIDKIKEEGLMDSTTKPYRIQQPNNRNYYNNGRNNNNNNSYGKNNNRGGYGNNNHSGGGSKNNNNRNYKKQ
jgi:hypothetical protein